MAWKSMIPGKIPPHWHHRIRSDVLVRRAPLFAILLLITWLGFSRMMAEGLGDSVYKFGHETLRAVQAWENHGFFVWGGFYPLSNVYIPADQAPRSVDVYQSYPPLYLLVYWPSYHFFGEAGFRIFKLVWSLAYGVGLGILLGTIASSCFTREATGYKQLVFASAYVITISNQAVLRYFMIDEPDYLGLFLLLLAVVLLQMQWSQRDPPRTKPWALWFVWFLAAWTYPILGALTTLAVYGLQRLRLSRQILSSLRGLLVPLLAGMAVYWVQRLIVNVVFPAGLKGSSLFDRMGLIAKDTDSHRGVLDALRFFVWQMSGSSAFQTNVAPSQVIEHNAVWVIGVLLFTIAFARSRGGQRQLVLILAAAQLWLFVPLLHQSLAHHDWIYAIHFVPTVVLGWVGAFEGLLPQRSGEVFAPWMLGFVATLIWAIQIRFFLVAYLT